jgi:hypothetical protein
VVAIIMVKANPGRAPMNKLFALIILQLPLGWFLGLLSREGLKVIPGLAWYISQSDRSNQGERADQSNNHDNIRRREQIPNSVEVTSNL